MGGKQGKSSRKITKCCKKPAKKQKSPTLAYAKGKRKLKTERLNSRRQILAADSAGADKVSSPEDKRKGNSVAAFMFLAYNLAARVAFFVFAPQRHVASATFLFFLRI